MTGSPRSRSSSTIGLEDGGDRAGWLGRRLDLLIGALARRFVGPPAADRGAVTEAPARDVIEADLDHELVAQRLVGTGALRRPARRAAWGVAGKTFAAKLFEARRERRLVLVGEGRGEADMVEQAGVVVEAKQQGPNELSAG